MDSKWWFFRLLIPLLSLPFYHFNCPKIEHQCRTFNFNLDLDHSAEGCNTSELDFILLTKHCGRACGLPLQTWTMLRWPGRLGALFGTGEFASVCLGLRLPSAFQREDRSIVRAPYKQCTDTPHSHSSCWHGYNIHRWWLFFCHFLWNFNQGHFHNAWRQNWQLKMAFKQMSLLL